MNANAPTSHPRCLIASLPPSCFPHSSARHAPQVTVRLKPDTTHEKTKRILTAMSRISSAIFVYAAVLTTSASVVVSGFSRAVTLRSVRLQPDRDVRRMTKSFTAMSIRRLRDEGKLSTPRPDTCK